MKRTTPAPQPIRTETKVHEGRAVIVDLDQFQYQLLQRLKLASGSPEASDSAAIEAAVATYLAKRPPS